MEATVEVKPEVKPSEPEWKKHVEYYDAGTRLLQWCASQFTDRRSEIGENFEAGDPEVITALRGLALTTIDRMSRIMDDDTSPRSKA